MSKQPSRNLLLLFTLIILASICISCGGSSTPSPNSNIGNGGVTVTPSMGYQGGKQYFPVGAFHIEGNLFVDSTGHKFLLHGSQIAGEFNARKLIHSELLASQHLDSSTFDVMNKDWNMNVVRIPTCDYLWQSNPSGYLSHLDSVVQAANAAKLVVVLDLHEDNRCGAPEQGFDFKLPLLLSLTYWKAIAAHYINNPDVIFDVYNEPAIQKNSRPPTDADWQLWLHGGTVEGVQVIGMQDLVNAIRSTGAKQVVMVEGLNGKGAFTGIGSNMINDSNVAYEVHIYFSQGELSSTNWDAEFGFLSSQHVVYIGEWAFLPNTAYPDQCRHFSHDKAGAEVVQFMNYMDSHNISWSAWAFMLNKLIQDYNYTPTSLDIPWTCGDAASTAGDGTLVKQHLLAYQ